MPRRDDLVRARMASMGIDPRAMLQQRMHMARGGMSGGMAGASNQGKPVPGLPGTYFGKDFATNMQTAARSSAQFHSGDLGKMASHPAVEWSKSMAGIGGGPGGSAADDAKGAIWDQVMGRLGEKGIYRDESGTWRIKGVQETGANAPTGLSTTSTIPGRTVPPSIAAPSTVSNTGLGRVSTGGVAPGGVMPGSALPPSTPPAPTRGTVPGGLGSVQTNPPDFASGGLLGQAAGRSYPPYPGSQGTLGAVQTSQPIPTSMYPAETTPPALGAVQTTGQLKGGGLGQQAAPSTPSSVPAPQGGLGAVQTDSAQAPAIRPGGLMGQAANQVAYPALAPAAPPPPVGTTQTGGVPPSGLMQTASGVSPGTVAPDGTMITPTPNLQSQQAAMQTQPMQGGLGVAPPPVPAPTPRTQAAVPPGVVTNFGPGPPVVTDEMNAALLPSNRSSGIWPTAPPGTNDFPIGMEDIQKVAGQTKSPNFFGPNPNALLMAPATPGQAPAQDLGVSPGPVAPPTPAPAMDTSLGANGGSWPTQANGQPAATNTWEEAGEQFNPQFIVYHYTDGDSFNGAASYDQNGDGTPDGSTNYVIEKDGTVHEIIPPGSAMPWANGATEGQGAVNPQKNLVYDAAGQGNLNAQSISIELVGTGGDQPTPQQIAAGQQLTGYLSGQYGIPMDEQHMVGHSDITPGTRQDPYPMYDPSVMVPIGTTPTAGVQPQGATGGLLGQAGQASPTGQPPTPLANEISQTPYTTGGQAPGGLLAGEAAPAGQQGGLSTGPAPAAPAGVGAPTGTVDVPLNLGNATGVSWDNVNQWDAAVAESGERWGVDPALIKAAIAMESQGYAVQDQSGAPASSGVLQIEDRYHRQTMIDLGYDPDNPADDIDYWARLMSGNVNGGADMVGSTPEERYMNNYFANNPEYQQQYLGDIHTLMGIINGAPGGTPQPLPPTPTGGMPPGQTPPPAPPGQTAGNGGTVPQGGYPGAFPPPGQPSMPRQPSMTNSGIDTTIRDMMLGAGQQQSALSGLGDQIRGQVQQNLQRAGVGASHQGQPVRGTSDLGAQIRQQVQSQLGEMGMGQGRDMGADIAQRVQMMLEKAGVGQGRQMGQVGGSGRTTQGGVAPSGSAPQGPGRPGQAPRQPGRAAPTDVGNAAGGLGPVSSGGIQPGGLLGGGTGLGTTSTGGRPPGGLMGDPTNIDEQIQGGLATGQVVAPGQTAPDGMTPVAPGATSTGTVGDPNIANDPAQRVISPAATGTVGTSGMDPVADSSGGMYTAEDIQYGFNAPGTPGIDYSYGAGRGTDGTTHTGEDIPVPYGEDYYAASGGEVVCDGTDSGSGAFCDTGGGCQGCAAFGNADGTGTGRVEVYDEATGISTIYGHTLDGHVENGQTVNAGDPLGSAGWKPDAAHYHLETRVWCENLGTYYIVDPQSTVGVTDGSSLCPA